MALAFAAQQFASQVTNDQSALRSLGGLVGTTISASFLYLIAFLNLVMLINIVRVFLEMRQGRYDYKGLEEHLEARGFIDRFFGRLSGTVSESWQMFPVGFLFGLGFETASEVALLAFASEAASTGLPLYAVICLPLIFAAGMTMMDTADGAFMSKAYGWAFSNPIRKIYYNITATALSVVVALFVGSFEILSILRDRFSLSGAFWDFIGRLDLGSIGYGIVGLFVAALLGSYGLWRL